MNNSILIVDDQQEILNTLRRLLQRDYAIFTALDGVAGLQILTGNEVSVILSDQRMPGMDGVTFLKKSMEIRPQAIRIMITGYADIEASINAVNAAHIYQYISKPFEPDELKLVIKRAVERYNLLKKNSELQKKLAEKNVLLERENIELKSHVSQQLDLGNFIGQSAPMQRVFKLIRKVVNTPTTVLLLGETGTGKELLARMIHFNSNRKNNTFVVQNCGAIPDTLLQSELFGHVKGAFTGAISDKKGIFEQANKGTIFLDEIGDTSQALQLGLLRVLQEGEVRPLGATKTIKTDVRVIAATNRDLAKDVQNGNFREDLYYRLNVFPIKLPPLRERTEDIPDLLSFFIDKYAKRIGKKITGIDDDAMAILIYAEFPGNVRELENEVERIITLADDNSPISADLLSERFIKKHESISLPKSSNTDLKSAIHNLEKTMITRTLSQTKGNILKSAAILGISRVGLHKMIKRHRINPAEFKM